AWKISTSAAMRAVGPPRTPERGRGPQGSPYGAGEALHPRRECSARRRLARCQPAHGAKTQLLCDGARPALTRLRGGGYNAAMPTDVGDALAIEPLPHPANAE